MQHLDKRALFSCMNFVTPAVSVRLSRRVYNAHLLAERPPSSGGEREQVMEVEVVFPQVCGAFYKVRSSTKPAASLLLSPTK